MSLNNRLLRLVLRCVLFFCTGIGFCSGAFASGALGRFTSLKIFQSASVGVSVVEVSGNKPVCESSPLQNLTPASTLKLLTTATALEMFGPGFCFETKLFYSGKIVDHVLQGNLYIRGSGDPTLGSMYSNRSADAFFSAVVQQLRALGIQRISGSVISDESAYNSEIIPPKTTWEDMGNYYAAGISALNFGDNAYRLTLKSGAVGTRPVVLSVEPGVAGLSFRNYLSAAANDKDSAYIYGMPFSGERSIYGTIPANRQAFVIRGDVPDPALFLAERLTAFLADKGVITDQRPTTSRILAAGGGFPGPGLTALLTFRSDSLAHIIRITNKKSYNLYAEALLRLIASRYSRDASLPDGLAAIRRFWSDRGLASTDICIYDGSGLAPSNRVNAAFITSLLSYMWHKSKYRDEYFNSLAVAGEDGTLRNFLVSTPFAGKVKAKSGSFEGVLSYCGIIEKNGKSYFFCVMVNAYTCRASLVKQAIEQFLIGL